MKFTKIPTKSRDEVMSADVPDKPLKLRNLTKSKKPTEPEAKKDEFDDEFGFDNEAPSLSLSYGSIFFL